ncbi:hypothetical protein N7481_005704 [Penicillium waksmanii]|uniref:uncharacterized protein n=1 Tax=Penicillium waksmanii TaxID=69791 RepID=UPI0025498744|nr:uncharacterized protein N7481_005704 [Penicillium waksmanii]KAJ5983605.1 hypothetical protein N7481_005704 [Penicillium waksmanii]
MWPDLGLDWESSSHEVLKKSCALYLDCIYAHEPTEKCQPMATLPVDVMNAYPFSKYAYQRVFYHCEMAAESNPQCEFLDSFQRSGWIEANNLFEKHEIRKYGPDASLIYILAEKGYPNLIRQWSERDPHVHSMCPKERYRYPFFAAIASGNQEAIAAILNAPSGIFKGVNILEGIKCGKDHRRYMDHTRLTWAAMNGLTSVIPMLLRQGLEIDEQNDKMESPLLSALGRGQELAVNLLLESGANTGNQDMFSSACEKGFRRLVIAMIENGTEIDGLSWSSETPLSLASENGHAKVVRTLIQQGATVNTRSDHQMSPLVQASLRGHKEVVRILIDNGANIDAHDQPWRYTPLTAASSKGHKDIVQILVDKGADIERVDGLKWTPLVRAMRYANHKAIVRFLLERGADIDVQDKDGHTALIQAVIHSDAEIVKLLIDFGADVNFKNDYGQTPLSVAFKEKPVDRDNIQLLIDHGAVENV